MINALSVDVEDYWNVFLRDWLGIADAEPAEAVVRNTEWFLQTLEEFGIKATFFVVGEVALKFPNLLREIANRGHEVGSHGYGHWEIHRIDRDRFRYEVVESKRIIEDITGQKVRGHRAPSFSIMPATCWALEEISSAGYEYDSSIFPFRGNRYGWPSFSKGICKVKLPNGRSIIEVPLSTVRIFGINLPACGGGYLRHFSYLYTRWAMKRIQPSRPVIVYVHPYDIDTEPGPEEIENACANGPIRAKMQHLLQLRNRHTMKSKLNRLLNDYPFGRICDVIGATLME
jgi:polysaccharide deacetylase family protein (PEP-CTERM system associated)